LSWLTAEDFLKMLLVSAPVQFGERGSRYQGHANGAARSSTGGFMSFQALRNWRALGGVVGALALAGAFASQAVPAAAHKHHHHHHRAHGASSTGASSNPFVAAVQRLVERGTIDQHQADAIDRQIEAGSLDGRELVEHGVVSEAQMRAVENAVTEVKQSLGSSNGGEPSKPPPPGQEGTGPGKQPQGGETGAKQ
jgi:hypothetical protein